MSHLVLRGIIDSHVHLREPGGEQKEDILSGTTAALAGGVIGVLDMPNTRPPTTDRRTFRQKEAILSRSAVSDYGLFLGLRAGITDDTLALAGHAVGLKLYLDQTYGDLLLQADTLHEVFERWPGRLTNACTSATCPIPTTCWPSTARARRGFASRAR
jgi:dihydroorotase-like cyclic amidohydrolase